MGHTVGACPADGQFFDSQNSEIPGGDYGALLSGDLSAAVVLTVQFCGSHKLSIILE